MKTEKSHFIQKAYVSKSVGRDWPRFAAVIPNSTKTQWFVTKEEAQKVVDEFNRVSATKSN